MTEQGLGAETRYCHRKKVYFTETGFCQTKNSAREKKFLQDTSFHHRKKFLFKFSSEKHILVIEEGKVYVTKKVFVTEFVLPQTKVFCQRKRLPSQKQGSMNLIYQGTVLSSP